MGDEAADGVAAVDADDVGADTIGDGAGRRGIGTGQVRRRGDDVDAVGAGGTSTQRARGAGVQRQRPMQRAGLRVERGDGDARLIAAVLSEVPDRLAGDVLGHPEGLDDGGGGTAGVIQHTPAIIEHTVVGGLDGTDAAQSVAESVRAVEREHAAETQVGGDEAELACRLVEDHGVAEDRERAEQAGRAVPGEGPVARTDLGDIELSSRVITDEGAGEGAADRIAGDERGAGGRMEVLDDGAGDAADRAQRDVGITAHVQDRPGGGEVHRGVGVVGGGAVIVGSDDERPGVDVDRERLGAETAELQDARAFLVNRAAGKDRSIDGQADLLVGLAGRAHDRGQAIRHPGDRDGGGGGQAQAAGQVRDDADVVQRRGTDGVGGVGQRQLAQTGGNGRAAADTALGVESDPGDGFVESVQVPGGSATDSDHSRIGDLMGAQISDGRVGDRTRSSTAGIAARQGQITGDGRATAGLVVQQQDDAVGERGADIRIGVGETDRGTAGRAARSEDRVGGPGDGRMDGQRIRSVMDEELRGRRGDPATGIGVGSGTDDAVLGVGTGEQAAGGESQRVERGASEGYSGRSVEGQGVDRPVASRNRRVGCQTKIAGR